VGDYFAFLAMSVVVSGFSSGVQETTLAVSGLMISFTLPRLFFGLLAGVFVDRWDRRRTMFISDVLRAGITLLMIPAFLSENLAALYALAFVMSSIGTVFNPAKGAIIPNLVSEDQLLSANSLSQTSQMLAVLVGPALAGFTLKVAGEGNEWVAFIVDSISYTVSAAAILAIRMSRRAQAPSVSSEASQVIDGVGPVRRVWDDLLVGLKTLILSRVMAGLTVIFAITMLGIGAINVLWIVYLKTGYG
jgi:MFS family permease